ncbi:hypothetical protein CTI14_67955, partial [Methylobacterium radiotolerans]
HGDFHLGQVLVAQTDAYLIDFEGEPISSLEVRRSLASPYKDVAGHVALHGDFHLGQVLVAQTDAYLIDFEGEPISSLEVR